MTCDRCDSGSVGTLSHRIAPDVRRVILRLICSSFLTPILFSAGTLLTSGAEISTIRDCMVATGTPALHVIIFPSSATGLGWSVTLCYIKIFSNQSKLVGKFVSL